MQKIAEKQLKRSLPKMDEGDEPGGFRYAQLPNGVTIRFKDDSFENGTYANYDNPAQRFQLDGTVGLEESRRNSAYHSEDVPAYVNALTGGFLLNLSPSQWARRGYDVITGDLTADSWFGGNDGVVSNNFAKQHPYLAAGANMLFDSAMFGASSIKPVRNYKIDTNNIRSFSNSMERQMYKDFLSGDASFPRWNSLVTNHSKYPTSVDANINNTTVSRIIRNRPYLRIDDLQRDIQNVLNGKWSEYSPEVYERAGLPNGIQGFYNDKNDFISIRKGADNFALSHEIRHKLDNHISLNEIEQIALDNAYGNTFLNLPNTVSKNSPLYGYRNIADEAVTTNRDARDLLLGRINSQQASLDAQNKIIQDALDEDIINSVYNANDYGRAYIDQLLFETNGKIPKEQIDAFRKAMQIVPVGASVVAGQNQLQGYNKGKSPIHIKPENRGKFNALKKRTGKTTEELTHSKTHLLENVLYLHRTLESGGNK